MKILMIAAENGALPGGKVGGMGDVIRDIPRALAKLGHQVDVICPGYQKFSTFDGAVKKDSVSVKFRQQVETLDIYQLAPDKQHPGLTTWVVEHPLLAPEEAGKIYSNDPPGRPFSTDASKFALFCQGTTQAILERQFGEPDVIHLHDWHTALIAILANSDPVYFSLKKIPFVYTIHNLSLQGIRPLSWDESALESWFPNLSYDYEQVKDPRYQDCFNPMRAAINLCDKVHVVSPNYLLEVQQPSNPAHGFVGGEGLEGDLKAAHDEQRLVGILNGCEYTSDLMPKANLANCITDIQAQLRDWQAAGKNEGRHQLALNSLASWSDKVNSSKSTPFIMTSVGRVSDQKIKLLQYKMSDGRSSLEHLLDRLNNNDLLIILGSGESDLEDFIAEVAAYRHNLIFVCGYAEALSLPIYASGDLFLMPSSFEPCGISQMLAMRTAQPCLVHQVGGLLDTVIDNVNGFGFAGNSPDQQAQNMLQRLDEVLLMRNESPKQWAKVKKQAAAARFLWSDVAQDYIANLYQ